MPPKFGTSGLRGLVVELTDELVGDHVRAFITACPSGTGIYVGRDLRDSSPAIAEMVIRAAIRAGVDVTDCGAILTPGLALAAMDAEAAAVMITGSHIPADRNGLKFYTPEGEITKEHEAAIIAALGNSAQDVAAGSRVDKNVAPNFIRRYLDAVGHIALNGQHIGVFSHSTVGRDVLIKILTGLGAKVTELGRSDTFIPVDTEAVSVEMRARLKSWANESDFDAIVSMDGDGDRPLVTTEHGDIIVGDVLGQITSRTLNARNVVTPISSNTGVKQGPFDHVLQTRIGSPYVIAGMQELGGNVVGYEANGGYLLGFDAIGPNGPISGLLTRDSILPILAVLTESRDLGLEMLVSAEPKRFTVADRLQGVATDTSAALVSRLARDPSILLEKIKGTHSETNQLDGLRLTLTDGRIVHLRPSGNAPELRFYVEADSREMAQETLDYGLGALREIVG